MNATEILTSFDLPTTVNAFVQEMSRQAEDNPSLIEELSDAFNVDLSAVEEHQQLTYLQYAVTELIRDETISAEEATDTAAKKTAAMFQKHPYLQPKNDPEEVKEVKVSDKKKQARAIYDANKDSKTLAELVNMIADELHITKANSRYYITRVFGHIVEK